jgi:2-hydroxy-6-oxonona-2,4-dienedioate hydrolase
MTPRPSPTAAGPTPSTGGRPAPAGEPAAPHRLRRDRVEGRELAVRAWDGEGDGRPVVLVHGLVVSSRYHVPLGDRLARRRPVLAPDLPGFGASERPRGHPDTRALGTLLARWLDGAGVAPVALVANSYGCQIATHTALARPDLFDRLVLLGPTMDPRGRRVGEQLRRWARESRTQTSALQRILFRDYARAGPRRALATFRHALADRIEDRLPHLHVPTLVVRGTRDPIVPQRWAEEATGLLPDGRLAVLPGATHAINHEQPAQTARVLDHFLAA